VTADRLALAVRTMKARRTSTCPSCHGPILVGQNIAKVTDPHGWIHLRCVPVVAEVLSRQASARKTPSWP
jgi:hypothetical protein